MGSTDPAAIHPERLDWSLTDDRVTELEGVAFETPGVQYLALTLVDEGNPRPARTGRDEMKTV